MALSMDEPRAGKAKTTSHMFGVKNMSQHKFHSPGMNLSQKHAYRSKVIGNVKEGQGYADKRKRIFLNNYQKLRRKQRLQSARKQNRSENENTSSDIDLFAQNVQKDEVDIDDDEINSSEGKVQGKSGREASDKLSNERKISDKGLQRSGGTLEKKKRFKKRGGKKNAKNRFSKAQEHFNEKRRAEEMRLQTLRKQQEERAEALERYHKKKTEQHQKLKKKTRRGQPLMKYHMEALLDKIKAQGT